MPTILVSALEVSSNVHLEELRKLLPSDYHFIGIFEGKGALYSPKDFSIMGFRDVIGRLGFLLRANREMAQLAKSADMVLLMDASSFNIPLAKKIKKKDPSKKIMYYILPQVWAWKKWRAKIIEKTCDFLGAILPFETSYYQKKARYVGHPLLDEIKYHKKDIKGNGLVFMPGSRRSEIAKIFPLFVEVAKILEQNEGIKKRTLVVPTFFKGLDLKALYGKGIELFEISYEAHKSLYEAEFAFICSGTATLEAALIGTPFVLAYRAKKIDFLIARMFVNLHYIGLANIFYNALNGEKAGLGESKLHPELIQHFLSTESLLKAYKDMDREKYFKESIRLREYLGKGSAKSIAKEIAFMLN
ncbi:lipid-A-disaccharide synthase [Helicobacter cetorum]|uniref:Lipid-A-disaccharide synthase n=1 Tax=Helicobacter cetorum (strain ATCC BAA-429 / MIT 00-7128) TaxID=182217 RepID=I0EMV8_HELC0|nr:lipid-A-disaccharide synthase [Helicobacter cetorum]AFI04277.1 ipid-A-disaccharide synthase [Helicobacter cetorum MIT 00-7128]